MKCFVILCLIFVSLHGHGDSSRQKRDILTDLKNAEDEELWNFLTKNVRNSTESPESFDYDYGFNSTEDFLTESDSTTETTEPTNPDVSTTQSHTRNDSVTTQTPEKTTQEVSTTVMDNTVAQTTTAKPTLATTEMAKATTAKISTTVMDNTVAQTTTAKPTLAATEMAKATTAKISTTENPKTTSTTAKTTERPKTTTEKPKTTSTTAKTTERPKTTTEKSKTTSTTAKTTERPKTTTEKSKTTSTTAKTTERPKPTTEKPKTTRSTAKTIERPKPTTEKPKITSTTAKTTERPKPTTEKPKTTSTTAKTIERPKTTTAKAKTTTSSKPKTSTKKVTEKPKVTSTTAKTTERPKTTTAKPLPKATTRKAPFSSPKITTPKAVSTTAKTAQISSTSTARPDFNLFKKDKFFIIPEEENEGKKSTTPSSVRFKFVDNRKVDDPPKYMEILGHLFPICGTFDHSKGVPGHQSCVQQAGNFVKIVPIGETNIRKTIIDIEEVESEYKNFNPKNFFTIPEEERRIPEEKEPPRVKFDEPKKLPNHFVLIKDRKQNFDPDGYFLINRPKYPLLQLPITVSRIPKPSWDNPKTIATPIYFEIQSKPKNYQNIVYHSRGKRSTEDKEDGVSLALVFDTSGSMGTELHLVKESAHRITQEILTNPNIAIHDFIFVPFQDQEKPAEPTKTMDREVFFNAINNVNIRGGLDCPERSLEGVLKAIKLARPNSFVYVFTDAYAKDYYLVPEIIALTQRKHPQIFFLLTGVCSDDVYPEEQVKAYPTIASVSSGLIIDLIHKTDVDEVLNYIPGNSKKGKVLLNSVNSETGIDKPYVIPLDIDPTIKEMTISTTGSNVSIIVLNPEGIYPDPKKIQELLNLDNINVFCVQQPEPGVWKINVTQANSGHSIVTTGLSSNTFSYGFSLMPTQEIKETSKRPQKGAQNYLLIKATSPNTIEKITHVTLVDLDGEILGQIPINEVNAEDGVYIGGPFIPPDQLFKIEINGETKDGYPLKRVTITAISPQLPEKPFITYESNLIATVGEKFNITCSIESLVPMSVKLLKKPHYLITKSFSQTSEISYHINEINHSHEGVYTCWAQNIAGVSSQDMYLQVKENPPMVEMEREMIGFKGESLSLMCHVRSLTPYSVFWSKKNLRDNSLALENALRDSEKIHLTDKFLKFDSLSESDEGIYVCSAKNRGGENSANVVLKIREIPAVEVAKNEIYFKNDSEIFLNCFVTKGIPLPSIVWSRNNSPLTVSDRFDIESEEGSSKLIIRNARQSDHGIYTCSGVNSVGKHSKEVKVYFGRPPIVTIKSYRKTINSLVGENLSIQCKVSGIPRPQLYWRKNGENVGNRDESSGILEIIKPTVADGGIYTCVGANTIGQEEDSINIFFGTKPEIVDIPSDIDLEIDEEAKLYCIATGIPEPTVSWRRIDGKQVEGNVQKNVLEINKATLTHAGTYICRAQNDFGFVEEQFSITITGATPPVILKHHELEVAKFLIGDRVELECAVIEGKPRPQIRWEHNGRNVNTKYFYGFISQNGSLIFNSFNLRIIGNYSCVAENAVGRDIKDVILQRYEPPKIDARSSTSVTANVGSPVVLQCEVTGDPSPTVKWTKEFNSPIKGHRRENSTFLYFDKVEVDDSGKYSCVAENLAGEVKKEINLQVLLPPKISPWLEEIGVQIGKVFSLKCNASGIPKPDIKWLKDNLPLTKTDSIFGQDIWFTASPEDAGVYTCLAENKAGIDRIDTKLVILEKPEINYLPSEIEVIKGKQATLICKATGKPPPRIYWEFNHNLSQVEWNSTAILNIPEISDSDGGVYFCVATNKVETVKKRVHLKVLEPPLITSWKKLEKAAPGEETILRCDVIANPKPKIIWYLNNELFPYHISSDGSLRFYAQKNHSGDFTCLARNKAGSDTKTMTLLILEPPKFHFLPKTVQALSGTNLDLLCIAFGDPKPQVYWEDYNFINKNPNKFILNQNGTLTIKNLTVEDGGEYTCKAKNKAGISTYNVQLTVFEIPKVKITTVGLQNGEVDESQELTIKCDYEGNPTPEIKWLKNNIPFPSRYKHDILKFKSEENHSGNYTCVAVNSVGSDSAFVEVTVKASPKFDEPEDEEMVFLENKDAELTCKVKGTPEPKITWFKNGQIIKNDFISERNGSSSLHLRNLTFEMSGNYSCVAVNVMGDKEKKFYVVVHALPAIADDLPANLTINEGEDYSIPCTVKGFPKPEIKWKIGSEFVPTKIFTDSYMVLGDNTLVLTNVSSKSSGDYQCVASNVEGSSSKTYKITVLAPVSSVEDGVELIEKLDGDTAKLYCNGDPGAEIIWLKNGVDVRKNKVRSDVQPHEIKDNGTRLNFEEIFSTSAGNYSCIIKNKGKNITKNFYLNVLTRPYPYDDFHESVFNLNEGERLQVDCRMGGNPTPIVTWRFSNSTYNSIPITNITFPKIETSSGLLTIDQADISHNGAYVCQGSNKVGKFKRMFDIKVTGKPKIIGNESEYYNVLLNHPLKLICDIEGLPEPSYSWSFASNFSLNSAVFKVDLSAHTRTLNLEKIQNFNEGTYYCEGKNEVGSIQKAFIINIIVPPIIQRNTTLVYKFAENSSFELSCITESDVFWKFNNDFIRHDISSGNSLKVVDATKENEGTYTCVASNKAGSTEQSYKVKIIEIPKILNKTTQIYQKIGSNFKLDCPVESDAEFEIIWTRDGMKTNNIIENAKIKDSGFYECSVTNFAGKSSAIINVKILVPPEILKNTSSKIIEALPGSELTIGCFSSGIPSPHISWSKKRNESFFDLFSTSEQFKLNNITESDAGTYRCLSQNEVGEDQNIFEIVVQNPSISSTTETVDVNQPLALKCPIDTNVTWFKANRLLNETKILFFHRILREDGGIYYCKDKNKIFKFYVIVKVNQSMSEWSSWSECSKSCNSGEHMRSRIPKIEIDDFIEYKQQETIQIKKCNVFACPVKEIWSEWSDWSLCPECGKEAFKTRYRVCNTPTPENGGCIGNSTEIAKCDLQSCPINGGWSDWSEWNGCSATCGNGVKMRTRICNDPKPEYGGKYCDGLGREIVSCIIKKCSVNNWSPWSEWSLCSVSCGIGRRVRSRKCLSEDSDMTCPGNNIEGKRCRLSPCKKSQLNMLDRRTKFI